MARWPGSTHDSHIFRTSAVGRQLEGGSHGLEEGVLLGDSGYPCTKFLMTPYTQPVGGWQDTVVFSLLTSVVGSRSLILMVESKT